MGFPLIFWLSICLQVSNHTQATQGNEVGVNSNNQGQPGNPNQSAPQGTQIPLGGGIPIPTLATVLILKNTFIY